MSECHQMSVLTKNEAQRGFRIGPCSWTYRRTKRTEKLEQDKHTARSHPRSALTTPQTRGFTSSMLETDF